MMTTTLWTPYFGSYILRAEWRGLKRCIGEVNELQKPMRTTRLELIPIDCNDFEVFKEINVDGFVRRYLWDDNIMPDDVFREILNDVEIHFKKDNWGLWKIVLIDSRTIIGYVGLWLFFDENQPQLLYAIKPEYKGKGYATESAKLIIDYAFTQLEFANLVATMDKANVDSQRVCERLAFKFIEEREVEGKPIVFYSLTNTMTNRTVIR